MILWHQQYIVRKMTEVSLSEQLHDLNYSTIFNAIADAVHIWPPDPSYKDKGLGISISVEKFISSISKITG